MTSITTTTLNGRYHSDSDVTTTTGKVKSRLKEAMERAARKRSEAARRDDDRQDLTDAYLDRTALEAVSLDALLSGYAGR
jgi:hypothetical protein